jgi:hypothetical protein
VRIVVDCESGGIETLIFDVLSLFKSGGQKTNLLQKAALVVLRRSSLLFTVELFLFMSGDTEEILGLFNSTTSSVQLLIFQVEMRARCYQC